MPETPVSLLERLRTHADSVSWRRLVDLYEPLIRGWLGRQGLQPSDRDDLAQEILIVVVRELPRFQHNNQRGAFRTWLRLITVNRLRAFWRTRKSQLSTGVDFERLLSQLEDPANELSRSWDLEHDLYLSHKLLELIEKEFEPRTILAFRHVVMEGKRAAEVAVELGVSVNAVLLAKCRVLSRLRQEGRGLLD